MVIILLSLIAVFAPYVAPQDPLRSEPRIRREAPSAEHWAGTDHNGRDVFSRLIHGARLSLMVGVTAVLIGTSVGAVWGLATGYMGRWFDLFSQRLVEVWMSFPSIILAMTLLVALGGGVLPVIIAISFTRVPGAGR